MMNNYVNYLNALIHKNWHTLIGGNTTPGEFLQLLTIMEKSSNKYWPLQRIYKHLYRIKKETDQEAEKNPEVYWRLSY